jgi:hypothetical protein
MRKKTCARRPVTSKPKRYASALRPHNDHAKDLFFHDRSFHLAAKKLTGALEFGSTPFADFDVSPVVFLYRHALELSYRQYWRRVGLGVDGVAVFRRGWTKRAA